jgi:hypothetical protein
MHYRRIIRFGGPGPVGMVGKWATLEERFDNRVERQGNCLVWTGPVHKSGFGTIGYKGGKLYVHRLAYQLAYGSIPLGARVRQVCRNRLCVRADHLRVGGRVR